MISIKGIEEDVKRLVEQGYTLKTIFETGTKVLLTKDENIKAMLETKDELAQLRRDIQYIRDIIQLIIQLNPTIASAKSELNNLISNINKANTELRAVSENATNSLKRITDIETDLKRILDKYKLTILDEMLSKLNEIDKLRLSLAQTFNIPSDYKDMQEMALKIAQLKQLISKLKESS